MGDAFWVRFNLRGLEEKGDKEKMGKGPFSPMYSKSPVLNLTESG